MQELIEAAEENAKGSIDQAEFMTLWVAFKAKVGEEGETEAEIKTAFKEYDLDGDGYITKDEMMKVAIIIYTKNSFLHEKEKFLRMIPHNRTKILCQQIAHSTSKLV